MHVGIISGVNFAAVSVLIFYIVSGYAISGLYVSHFSKRAKIHFYADRILRLFPIYVACFFLTFLVLVAHPRVHLVGRWYAWLNNLFPALLNTAGPVDVKYFRVIDDGNNFLLPQSWSLASEMQFYFFLPFLLSLRTYSKKFFTYVYYASFFVFAIGVLGIIPTEFYSYRFSAGTLFFFICGIQLFFDDRSDSLRIWQITSFLIFPLCLFMQKFEVPFDLEALLGVVVGFPLVQYVAEFKIKSRRDEFLGAISYPIYLSHFAFIWLLDFPLLKQFGGVTKSVAILILIFLTSAALVIFIEKPFQKFRRSLRETTDLKT